jgi:ATP/maltotriose-dependent transcriptional regulator MalT
MQGALDTLRQSGMPVDQPRYRMTERSYAKSLGLSGRFAEAQSRLERLRELARVNDGKDSYEYAITTLYLAQLAQRTGDPGQGGPLLEESMSLWPALVPSHHKVFALAHRIRASFARMQGDLALAEREQRAALARQVVDKATPMDAAIARAELASILFERGDSAHAHRLLDEALPTLRRALEPQHVQRAEAEKLARTLGI